MDTGKLISVLLLALVSSLPALHGQPRPVGRAVPALCVTLNPGDCVNCTQAVHLLKSDWLRGVPRAVVVREDLSLNERRTLARELGCEADSSLVLLANDSLYTRLNRSPRSFFHIVAPNGRAMYSNLLPSMAAYGDRTLANLLFEPPRHEKLPLPPALELLGHSEIQAVGDTLQVYSRAMNRWYSWNTADGTVQAHRFDQLPAWQSAYQAWTGDTTGFATYVDQAHAVRRVLGLPVLQLEFLAAEPVSQPAQLLKMYFPKRVPNPKVKGTFDQHWVPEQLVVASVDGQLDTLPLRPFNYGTRKREFTPFYLIHQQGNRLFLFVDEYPMSSRTPYHAEYRIEAGGRLKPQRVRYPRYPKALTGTGPLACRAHGAALVYERGWVYRFDARQWTRLPAPADSLRLVDARYDQGFFQGIYRTPADSLLLAVWTATGQLVGSWPLNASVARARSNVWLTGRSVFWIDDNDYLHRLRVRHPLIEPVASP